MNFLDHSLHESATDYLDSLAKSTLKNSVEYEKAMQKKQDEMVQLSNQLATLEKVNIALKNKITNTNQSIHTLISKLKPNGIPTTLREKKLVINWSHPIILKECLVTKGAFIEESEVLFKADGLDFSWKLSGFIKELLKKPGDVVTPGDSAVAVVFSLDA